MWSILDWIIVIGVAVLAPWAYAHVGGYFMDVAGEPLPAQLSGPLSQYAHHDWLWLVASPLVVLGHAVLLVLLKDTSPRPIHRAVIGAAAQGVAWAALAAAIVFFVMDQDANIGGRPLSVGSQLAAQFGVQLTGIAAAVFAAMGAASGAVAGLASTE
ncbi:MAG: hypothetical protein ABL932_18855 [Terricaulis sp.]